VFRRESWPGILLACVLAGGWNLAGFAQAADEASPAAAANAESGGKLYVTALLKVKDAQGDVKDVFGFLEVDAHDGTWRTVIDWTKETGFGPAPQVRVSPNGETLAISGRESVHTCDAKEALSFGKLADVRGIMSWRPDGKSLYVSENINQDEIAEKNNWRYENWLVRADGGPKSPAPVPSTDLVCDVSPDGTWLVTFGHGRSSQLYLMRADGTDQRQLTREGSNFSARFSPDGLHILFSSSKDNRRKIKTIPVDGNTEQTVAAENLGVDRIEAAAWSPDGKRVALIRHDVQRDGKGRRRIQDSNYRIEIVDVDGTNSRILPWKGANVSALAESLDWRTSANDRAK